MDDPSDDLVDEIATTTGVQHVVVRRAVGIILNFLRGAVPAETIAPLFDRMPGASALADANAVVADGLLGVFNALGGAGLRMAEIQAVAMAFVASAKARAGEEEVNAVIGSVPGLAQFV